MPRRGKHKSLVYMINEGDIPAVQCEVYLRCSESLCEIDGPNFISMILMFQRSHLVWIELSPRSNFLRTYPFAICGIVHIVSSAKRDG
jgi:hypothetical protein